MKRFLIAVIIALLALGQEAPVVRAATTILPPGMTCFSGLSGTTGFVGALGTITGGTGGTAGTYGGVALTGGSGSGATANITVAGGAVTAVAVLNPGSQYVVGDVLSAASGDIGSVSGFSVPVNSVSLNSALAGGSVTFYVPSTSTFKQTWQDSSQAVQNTNPVTLDQNGCALIYGVGSYRQVVKDSLGNILWDAITADASSFASVFWAGQAGGTPNTITVVDPGFTGTDGAVINFVALAANTGPATLNPSGFGAIPIQKDTSTGPVALTGGEIAIAGSGQGNVVSVVYSATSNTFQILNLISASASSNLVPLCGATHLRIVNDPTFPNSKVNITADQIVMQTTTGSYISRGSPASPLSFSVNFTSGTVTATAGGLDGEAFSVSTWFNIYAIDNGIAPNGLASTSATAPAMPSGYSYRCRLGAVRNFSDGNLLRSIQAGNRAQYTVTAATNTATLPTLITGTSGTACDTATATYAATPVASLVPPTATEMFYVMGQGYNSGSQAVVLLAPNVSYTIGATDPSYDAFSSSAVATWFKGPGSLLLEGSSVATCSSDAGGYIAIPSWRDSVNAN